MPVVVLHFVLKIEIGGAVKMAVCTHVQDVVAPRIQGREGPGRLWREEDS